MYYLLYAILYLISLLPFFILYRVGDLMYFLLYHVAGYRKEVVRDNLMIAFPEKSAAERKKIEKEFYRIFTDTFIETIKIFSLSERAIRRRVKMDLSVCDPLIQKGKNIHLLLGHQMNWEYGNLINVLVSQVPTINVYLRLNNKIANRLVYKLRGRFGGNLVSVQGFRNEAAALMKQQYSMGLIADQSPGEPPKAYWLNFFGRPTGFISGPDKSAARINPAFVFLDCKRIRRGHYVYEAIVVAENGADFQPGELTRKFVRQLENSIRSHPANYLWSHRRWKHTYKMEYEKNWVDLSEPPKVN